MGYSYTKTLLVDLRFTFNWVPCILSGALIREEREVPLDGVEGLSSSLSIWRAGLLPEEGGSGLGLKVDTPEPGGHAEGGEGQRQIRAVDGDGGGAVAKVSCPLCGRTVRRGGAASQPWKDPGTPRSHPTLKVRGFWPSN